MHHTLGGGGGSFSWIFFPFIQKKKKKTTFVFLAKNPIPHSRSRKSSSTGGMGAPLASHLGGRQQQQRGPRTALCQRPLAHLPVGLGPGGPTCRLLGAVRPRRSLCGLWEAWQPSPPSRRAARITSLDPQFLCSGGWQKIYCTSDSGTWQGLAGAGGGRGARAWDTGPG